MRLSAVGDGMRFSRLQIALFALALALVVAAADYVTGFEISLVAFYIIPISLAAWYVGRSFAFVVALGCALLTVYSNFLTGPPPAHILTPLWNCGVRLLFYACLILVMARLRNLQRNLESLAQERAAALVMEIAERERLERQMLAISEREQRRIGQDLHDGLCQHLTGTALATHVLAESLAEGPPGAAAQARKIVDLVEDGINLARGIAKGLHPVELQADGLMQALEEFTASSSELFGMDCCFECPLPVLVHGPTAATHLFRIAQEGVRNAIKHGRATRIIVSLEESEVGLQLAVCDNGAGIPKSAAPASGGMGLRIMADRAKMIGGRFAAGPGPQGGTQILCLIPQAALAPGGAYA
jgi:signal transduction histidine kinase